MKTYPLSIIVIILVVLASACGPAQTAAQTAVSPTNVSPTVVETPLGFTTGHLDKGGVEQPAGKYQTPVWFDVPFEFETTETYRGGGRLSERGQIFALERGQNSIGEATHRLVFFAFPIDVSGTELTFRLRESPLLDSGEISDITIFNLEAVQWEAIAQPNPAQKDMGGIATNTIPIPVLFEQMRLNGIWHTATPGARLQFIVVEPPGRTMLIYVEAPVDDFDTWMSETEELFKTVSFVTLSEESVAATAAVRSNTPPSEIWGVQPGALAIDAQDNVYIMRADAMIYKYDATGMLLAQWGGPGSGEGQFKLRDGSYMGLNLAVDDQGNVFVVDIGNDRVQKFDTNGNFLKQWGSEGKEPGQFVRGWAIAVDSKGNVYVGEEGNQRVQKFDNEGNFLMQWGTFGPGDNQFYSIYSIDVDHGGNIYVSDYYQEEVKKFDSNGNLLLVWNSCGEDDLGKTIRPIAFAFDKEDNVYMLDGFSLRVCIYDSDGRFLQSWGGQGEELGEFNFREDGDIVMDSKGNLYVVEGASAGYTGTSNMRIQKFQLNK